MNKVIFRLAVSCLAFWILSPILLSVLGIEIHDSTFRESYDLVRFWGVPVCIFLTIFGTVKPTDNYKAKVWTIMLTGILGLMSILVMVMVLFMSMCSWTDLEILYSHIEDKNTTIVEREYGCGAYDSDLPTVEIHRMKRFGRYFVQVKEVDLTVLDHSKWMKMAK